MCSWPVHCPSKARTNHVKAQLVARHLLDEPTVVATSEIGEQAKCGSGDSCTALFCLSQSVRSRACLTARPRSEAFPLVPNSAKIGCEGLFFVRHVVVNGHDVDASMAQAALRTDCSSVFRDGEVARRPRRLSSLPAKAAHVFTPWLFARSSSPQAAVRGPSHDGPLYMPSLVAPFHAEYGIELGAIDLARGPRVPCAQKPSWGLRRSFCRTALTRGPSVAFTPLPSLIDGALRLRCA